MNLFSNIVLRIAKRAQIHEVRKDFAALIFILLLAIIGTHIFSIKEGFVFAKFLLHDTAAASTGLSIVEIAVYLFIGLAAKFILQNAEKWKIVFSIIGSLVFMAISFFLTAEGFSLRKSTEKDTSVEVRTDYKNEIEAERKRSEAIILTYTNQMKSIEQNPAGWNQGKRTSLTKEQQDEMSELTEKIRLEREAAQKTINELKAEQKGTISQIKSDAARTGKFFWYVGAVVVVLQLVLNFALTFVLIKVLNEHEPDEQQKRQIKEQTNEIVQTVNDFNGVVMNMIKHNVDMITEGLQNVNKLNANAKIAASNETEVSNQNQNVVVENVNEPTGVAKVFGNRNKNVVQKHSSPIADLYSSPIGELNNSTISELNSGVNYSSINNSTNNSLNSSTNNSPIERKRIEIKFDQNNKVIFDRHPFIAKEQKDRINSKQILNCCWCGQPLDKKVTHHLYCSDGDCSEIYNAYYNKGNVFNPKLYNKYARRYK